jgi:hypothetical protein
MGDLASAFDRMGVSPPGAGSENPLEKRREEIKTSESRVGRAESPKKQTSI